MAPCVCVYLTNKKGTGHVVARSDMEKTKRVEVNSRSRWPHAVHVDYARDSSHGTTVRKALAIERDLSKERKKYWRKELWEGCLVLTRFRIEAGKKQKNIDTIESIVAGHRYIIRCCHVVLPGVGRWRVRVLKEKRMRRDASTTRTTYSIDQLSASLMSGSLRVERWIERRGQMLDRSIEHAAREERAPYRMVVVVLRRCCLRHEIGAGHGKEGHLKRTRVRSKDTHREMMTFAWTGKNMGG